MCRYKKYVYIWYFYHVVFKIMHFQISVYFVVIFTDYRVTNLVRVGTWHSVKIALSTSQSDYITSHIKPKKRIWHSFSSIFEDTQRAWQWKIHYYICYHFHAILTCVNIHINLKSFPMWHAFQTAQFRGRH